MAGVGAAIPATNTCRGGRGDDAREIQSVIVKKPMRNVVLCEPS